LLHFGSESFDFHLLSRNLEIKMYKIIILRVVLYWYENWPHTHTHTKGTGGDVRGFWRMLHNEELHNL